MVSPTTHTETTQSLARRSNRKKRRQRLNHLRTDSSDSSDQVQDATRDLSNVFRDQLGMEEITSSSSGGSLVPSSSNSMKEEMNELDVVIVKGESKHDDDEDEDEDSDMPFDCVDDDNASMDAGKNNNSDKSEPALNHNITTIELVQEPLESDANDEQERNENSAPEKPVHHESDLSVTNSTSYQIKDEVIEEDAPPATSAAREDEIIEDGALPDNSMQNSKSQNDNDDIQEESSSAQVSTPIDLLSTNESSQKDFDDKDKMGEHVVQINETLENDDDLSEDSEKSSDDDHYFQPMSAAVSLPLTIIPPPPPPLEPPTPSGEDTADLSNKKRTSPEVRTKSSFPPLSPKSSPPRIGVRNPSTSKGNIKYEKIVSESKIVKMPPPPPSSPPPIHANATHLNISLYDDIQRPAPLSPAVTDGEESEGSKDADRESHAQVEFMVPNASMISPPPPPPSSAPPPSVIDGSSAIDKEKTSPIESNFMNGVDDLQQEDSENKSIKSISSPSSTQSTPPAAMNGGGKVDSKIKGTLDIEEEGVYLEKEDEQESIGERIDPLPLHDVDEVDTQEQVDTRKPLGNEVEEINNTLAPQNCADSSFLSENEADFYFRQGNDAPAPIYVLPEQSALSSPIIRNDEYYLDATVGDELLKSVNTDALTLSMVGESAPVIDPTPDQLDPKIECQIPGNDDANNVEINEKSSPSIISQSPKDMRVKMPPVSPMNPKMAEKIALASSIADKRFNDMLESKNDHSVDGLESPSVIENTEVMRGAFTPLSNSTNACISPMGSVVEDSSIAANESTPFTLDLNLEGIPRKLDSELVGMVEVQLSPRPQSFMGPTHYLLKWLHSVLQNENSDSHGRILGENKDDALGTMKYLLNHPHNINKLCEYVADNVNSIPNFTKAKDRELVTQCDESNTIEGAAMALLRKRDELKPFQIQSHELAAGEHEEFNTFLRKVGFVSGIDCPQLSDISDATADPFSAETIENNISEEPEQQTTLQQILFGKKDTFLAILTFLRKVIDHDTPGDEDVPPLEESEPKHDIIIDNSYSGETGLNAFGDECLTPRPPAIDIKKIECLTDKRDNRSSDIPVLETLNIPPPNFSLYYKSPAVSPCPFEISIWNLPSIVSIVLGCLGDPVAVCRMKMVNKFCNRIVNENEYIIMKDAVRLGGISTHIRPAFWMWITLEKCQNLNKSDESEKMPKFNFKDLEQKGIESKWHHIIVRDVIRAFGNFPPHKANSSRRNSIVRALVTWGQHHLLRRHEDGTCRVVPASCPSGKPIRSLTISPPPQRRRSSQYDESTLSIQPSEIVSDWGGISPVGSTVSSNISLARTNSLDLVLAGNELTVEVKADLQKKLGSILDVIAAVHDGFGYCQGMDYVVAHLLRVLQETIEWNAPKDRLPTWIQSANDWKINKVPLRETEIVEETVFHVMNTFLTTYNLRHMYWPELRCLKTCCRVFSILIEKKLPVLADHFEHHDLNIGLFALGWFQTMYLYIPSMPSKTINRMWDVWLVERSMKIFFRVGTAILFLSQPILLNHELEGMMQYLNTFPDSTIFNADILMNCALQIKITNSMLAEIETSVMRENEIAHGLHSDIYEEQMMRSGNK